MNKERSVGLLATLFVGLVAGRGGIPGGIYPMNANDPTVREMAVWAGYQLVPVHYLLAVVKAQGQVVGGFNYFITAIVKTVKHNGMKKTKICKFVVLDRPWIPKRKLTYTSC